MAELNRLSLPIIFLHLSPFSLLFLSLLFHFTPLLSHSVFTNWSPCLFVLAFDCYLLPLIFFCMCSSIVPPISSSSSSSYLNLNQNPFRDWFYIWVFSGFSEWFWRLIVSEFAVENKNGSGKQLALVLSLFNGKNAQLIVFFTACSSPPLLLLCR